MSDENSALSVTLKADDGYEAPWINVRADDPETLRSRLSAVVNSDLAELVSQAAIGLQANYAAAKGLGAQPVSEPAPAWGAPAQEAPIAQVVPFPGQAQPFQGQPQASGAQRQEIDKWGNIYTWNVPGAPSCPHGPRILKQGKKKDGSPYQSYSCPQIDKFYRVQTDCKPVYV